MSEENNTSFDISVAKVKSLPGGVRAFVLIALAAEKDDSGDIPGVSAMAGTAAEIMSLMSDATKCAMKNIILKDFLSEERKNDE